MVVGSSHILTRVYILTWQFCSNEKGDEVEEFFEGRVRPSFAMNLKQSIEQARIKARFVQSIKQERQPLQYLLKQLACKG